MKAHISILFLMCIMVFGITGCGEVSSKEAKEVAKETESETNKELNKTPEKSTVTKQNEPPMEHGSDSSNDQALKLLNKLSVEEKVGQMVIVGVEGKSMDPFSQKLVNTYHVGGFIFFKDNIESTNQAVQLFNELKKENKRNPVPLWMSVDEEGGRVTRMPDSFLRIPSSERIGQKNDPLLAQEAGSQIGQRLKGFGLNMAFSPVLDVNSNPDNPVIGNRSFGSNAEVVGELGTAMMKGIQESGVVPAVKHFPGHGDTSVDSHFGLPVVDYGMNRLQKLELVPFKKAMKQGADVVMVAHLLMTQIDPDTPASYSRPVITGLLREQLGFKGVVITDDIIMGAVTKGKYDIGEVAVQSILAGSNIVLVGHEYDKEEVVVKSLIKAVNSNRISEEILNDRVLATLRLKQKYNINDNSVKGPDVLELNQKTKQLISKLK